ncbi:hypothetical protein LCGC14_3078230, partial [marine sediment metagenome]
IRAWVNTGMNGGGIPIVANIYEAVGFALGAERRSYTIGLFKKFEAAKKDLAAGRGLPLEVLEGIRSSFHPDVPADSLLELTKHTMTAGQRMATQRRAAEAGVEVDFDPTQYDPVKLYLYAFEMGMTEEIAHALGQKAAKAALAFPFEYEVVGILVDCSASMYGDETQKLRPIATALAVRDLLMRTADVARIRHAGGEPDDRGLVLPSQDTELATSLVQLLEMRPDVVYVISDGYENAPAGRFAEVMAHLKRIGIKTPVYHLNPVMAAESAGVRELAPGLAPTMPVHDPSGLGISFLRGVLEAEPLRGINTLLKLAVKPDKKEALT